MSETEGKGRNYGIARPRLRGCGVGSVEPVCLKPLKVVNPPPRDECRSSSIAVAATSGGGVRPCVPSRAAVDGRQVVALCDRPERVGTVCK